MFSSEIEEQHRLIKLLLSNLMIEGEKLLWEFVKPFYLIVNCSDRSNTQLNNLHKNIGRNYKFCWKNRHKKSQTLDLAFLFNGGQLLTRSGTEKLHMDLH